MSLRNCWFEFPREKSERWVQAVEKSERVCALLVCAQLFKSHMFCCMQFLLFENGQYALTAAAIAASPAAASVGLLLLQHASIAPPAAVWRVIARVADVCVGDGCQGGMSAHPCSCHLMKHVLLCKCV